MFQQVVAEIESGSVFFDMTISNTPNAALRRLKASAVLREAMEELQLAPENLCLYLDNARKAFSVQVPAGYASPEDSALAAYVSLLANVPEGSVQKFVDEVAASGRADLPKAVWVARYYVERVPSLTVCKLVATPMVTNGFTPPRRNCVVSQIAAAPTGGAISFETNSANRFSSLYRTSVCA